MLLIPFFQKKIWNRYGEMIHEYVNPICMRYWYPEELENELEQFGFKILQKWGGYENQEYGTGPELVIKVGL